MTSIAKIFANLSAHTAYIRILCVSVALITLHGILQRLRSRRETSVPRRLVRRSDGYRRQPGISFDKTLFRRILSLLRICFPSFLSVESGLVVLLTIILTLRTTITLKFAQLIGINSKRLVEKDFKQFVFGIVDVALYAIPATVTAVGINYTTSTMEMHFRERLQNTLHQEYFEGNKLYDLLATMSVDNPAHRLTNDVQRFCNELAGLLPAVLKPLMDIFIISSALAKFGGYGVPSLMLVYYTLVGLLFRVLLPNFAHLIAKSREKEGNLRMLHTQLIQHAEEIAFYRGAEVEGENAKRFLRSYIRLERHIKRIKWWTTLLNSLLVRYGATCVGYIICAIVVNRQKGHLDTAGLTQLHIQSTQLYIPLSMAMGRLLLLHLKIGALCGSAHRVGELRDALSTLKQVEQDVAINTVKILDHNEIIFKDAAIATPSDQIIIPDFTATFKEGRHILIMGCNGSGKTALFRTLCGLWPLRSGNLQRPSLSHIIFLTQRVYLPPGSLRTQLIYPTVEEEIKSQGDATLQQVDNKLLKLISVVGLAAVVEREGGLDRVREWVEVLSGGERQRVAMVRAMFHQPKFVCLDECTSAVSQEVEPVLYAALQHAGLTLLTISHHETLRSLHREIVDMDGEGGYTIAAIEDSP